jgi:sec-independent protein translocase protein TatA
MLFPDRRIDMPQWLGAPELLIILVIVILIFGVGRIANIGGELGKGINAFRKGLKGDEPEEKSTDEEKKEQ